MTAPDPAAHLQSEMLCVCGTAGHLQSRWLCKTFAEAERMFAELPEWAHPVVVRR